MPNNNSFGAQPSVEELTHMIKQGVDYFLPQIAGYNPRSTIVLGSGLKKLTNYLTNSKTLPYLSIREALPFWPVSTAPGHDDGAFWIGKLNGKGVIIFRGRVHPYDGFPLWQLAMPYRIMAEIGVKTLLLTNATGGVNFNMLEKGDIVIASDMTYLFMPPSPMSGPKLPQEERFTTLSPCFDRDLRLLMENVAIRNCIKTHRGTYAQVFGPHYESGLDGTILYANHVDAVGMSVGHEALVFKHRGLKVGAICMITDMLPPFAHGEVPTEQMVLENALSMEGNVNTILKGTVDKL